MVLYIFPTHPWIDMQLNECQYFLVGPNLLSICFLGPIPTTLATIILMGWNSTHPTFTMCSPTFMPLLVKWWVGVHLAGPFFTICFLGPNHMITVSTFFWGWNVPSHLLMPGGLVCIWGGPRALYAPYYLFFFFVYWLVLCFYYLLRLLKKDHLCICIFYFKCFCKLFA